ncbi:MAG TPA: hypothetical protein DCY14_08830 [Anaerolineae bacterium]|nr:hypothetical protein [Anaerolineae bacterium]
MLGDLNFLFTVFFAAIGIARHDTAKVAALLERLHNIAPVIGCRTVRKDNGAVIAALFGFQERLKCSRIAFDLIGEPESLYDHAETKAIFMRSHDGVVVNAHQAAEKFRDGEPNRVSGFFFAFRLVRDHNGRVDADLRVKRAFRNGRFACLRVGGDQSQRFCGLKAEAHGLGLAHIVRYGDKDGGFTRFCIGFELHGLNRACDLLGGLLREHRPHGHCQQGSHQENTGQDFFHLVYSFRVQHVAKPHCSTGREYCHFHI